VLLCLDVGFEPLRRDWSAPLNMQQRKIRDGMVVMLMYTWIRAMS
jgi:hypothetical protein